MARQARTAISDWASVEVKDHSGAIFYTLEDLRFEVELCGGAAVSVLAIETETAEMRNGHSVKRLARLTDADPMFHVIVDTLDIGTLEFVQHNADTVNTAEDEHYEALRDAALHAEAL